MMRKIRILRSDGIPHYLYDLSLPREERPQRKERFVSACAVATYLCVEPQRIIYNRKRKLRIWSPRFNKWYAVRVVQ